ncbi:hypothetical protein LZ554_006313 [Drepanopeziza brunnea f. sp. 'monogermtubi']|nr:hypothetical protein LZ554_006313 [Drepanopeziza brunnea f. sp. 'monogermtubi']
MTIEYLCKPVPARMLEHSCICMDCARGNPASECDRCYRIHKHTGEVNQILARCPEIATLLVGPNETKLTCHKALLGFYSNVFEAHIYTGSHSSRHEKDEEHAVKLSLERPEAIAVFLTWLYSGQLECDISGEELWALGDRLRSPLFCNEVMASSLADQLSPTQQHLLYAAYAHRDNWMTAQSASVAFAQAPGSLLYEFVCDYLRIQGPLCAAALLCHDEHGTTRELYEGDWDRLIAGGGDLVLFVAKHDGFVYDSGPELPQYATDNKQEHYLLDEHHRSVDAFLEGIEDHAGG